MKIAVVGSGVSGLVSAYYLSRLAEVHVFEAGERAGGHTHTVNVGGVPVDTGFIVFNDRTYPRFIRLMEALGVASQPSAMSFSVRAEADGFEYNGTDLNGLFAQRRHLFSPRFYRMILDILRFNKRAPSVLEDPALARATLGEYLAAQKYSAFFIDRYILPMGAAIWSAGLAAMKDFPLAYFVQFFKNHGMLSVDDRPVWRVIKNGSNSYIPALTAPFKERLYLNAPALALRREKGGVRLAVERAGRQEDGWFDHVVLAGHADESLGLLADATDAEKAVLGSFPYQENPTVLHTDVSVMPQRRRAWAAWNYLIPARPQAPVAVTYDMNILQGLAGPETFLVSLNMEERIAPEKIIKKIRYHHPIYTAAGVAAQKRWAEISGAGGVHFAGAYWGFGFHEDGVKSGERVAQSLGVEL